MVEKRGAKPAADTRTSKEGPELTGPTVVSLYSCG